MRDQTLKFFINIQYDILPSGVQNVRIKGVILGSNYMLKFFIKYLSVGVVNTLIHWLIFLMLFYYAHTTQNMANLSAFCVAVTFSFFANARWTFNSEATTVRYIVYAGFMGSMAFVIGWIADRFQLPPLITVFSFSLFSLVCGFFYSKLIVFKERI